MFGSNEDLKLKGLRPVEYHEVGPHGRSNEDLKLKGLRRPPEVRPLKVGRSNEDLKLKGLRRLEIRSTPFFFKFE